MQIATCWMPLRVSKKIYRSIMKSLLSSFVFIVFIFQAISQDTLTVQTFTRDNNSRRGVFEFPDNGDSYRKILMYYNMRCHGALVGNGNVGCYEWDYSCNTFLTDSSRVDSIQASIGSYVISGFNGLQFYFTTQPVNTYYKYIQKNSGYTSVVSEQRRNIGTGTIAKRLQNDQGTFRSQYVYTAQELLAAGATAGAITGLRLNVAAVGSTLPHFRIRLKSITNNIITPESPETEGLTEVYFKDTEFNKSGSQHFQFYTPFQWNGTSSILVDLSYTDLQKAMGPEFSFHDTGNAKQSIASSGEEKSLVWDGLNIKTEGGKLNSISTELTVCFWSYGTAHNQPTNGSLIEGLDKNGQRALNIHLPWSNGGIYFDCGFENGGYDRIEKAAMVNDYEAQWIHWAFTKNALTGEMKIYRNGVLWQSGSIKLKPIQISQLSIGAPLSYNGPYYGRMRALSIWNKVLDSATIDQWKHHTLDATHPQYANLLYYYDMQDNHGTLVEDKAPNPENLYLPVALKRHQERGDKMVLNFEASSERPNITFVQGVYSGTKVEDMAILDSVPLGPRKVIQHAVVNNDLVIDSIFYVYAAGFDNVYFENGNIAENILIDPEDFLEVSSLKYFRKTPAKYELISLVTPYGNGLDLGINGKTFVFDVTDFTPLLKGKKLLSMEMGGENQEEIDLKFVFIKGTPERQVLDISNVWPFQRGGFGEILQNTRFEPRKLILNKTATDYKLRFSVTGHEQNGEFEKRNHFVTVNGNATKKFPFTVWKECGDNPIYPQGGTWIFDRAGWCPGAATDLHSFDISNLIPGNKEITVDYGVEPPQLDAANYLVSSQLVAYGPMNYAVDAAIEEILKPSTGRVEFERLNPSCNKPTILIRNSGSQILNSLKIRYGIKNGIKEEYSWSGSLQPTKTEIVELPITKNDFWTPGPDSLYVFEAELSEPNQTLDQNIENNRMESPFKKVDSYSVSLFFEFRTNNVPADNDYRITNRMGEIVLERSNMMANTIYRDELLLPPGCYTLWVNDVSDDGLSFWFFPGNGNGGVRLLRKVNNVFIPVRQFNPDFGAGFQYDFVIAGPVASDDHVSAMRLSIIPNPVTDDLQIEYETSSREDVQLRINTMEGKPIVDEKLQRLGDKFIYQSNIQNLKPGVYFVQLIQNHRMITRKFVKN